MPLKNYALVENGVVVNTSVADETWDSTGWIEIDDANPAGIGYTYDEQSNKFAAPQPFPSWILLDSGEWTAPIPVPTDSKYYIWSEETFEWVEA